MSTVSPSTASPLRSREASNGDPRIPWRHGSVYDPSMSPYHHGPPPLHSHSGVPSYPSYYRSPQEFWPPETRGGGYWGPTSNYDRGAYHYDTGVGPHPTASRNYSKQRSDGHPSMDSQASPSRVPPSPGNMFSTGSIRARRGFRHAVVSRAGPSAPDKKKGDALSILANVSADMDGKDGKAASAESSAPPIPIPAPTSPLQRRTRPSPITPSQTPQTRGHQPSPQVTPIGRNRRSEDYAAWERETDHGYLDQASLSHYPRHRGYHPYYDPYGNGGFHEGNSPALVERGGSFDSQVEPSVYREYQYQPVPAAQPYYYEDHQPAYSHYWDGGGHMPPGYLPPRWAPDHTGEPYHHEYTYDKLDDSFPSQHPSQFAPPYTYVQQPRLEEKTILRKKFSWKHYPELERFLIANRDEYLKHSSMNYTAEQKQYNNWLTERLLEVAEQNRYVFDPDDFNFVAVRDRIRCYYKSYVQTARKRGVKLPEKKSA